MLLDIWVEYVYDSKLITIILVVVLYLIYWYKFMGKWPEKSIYELSEKFGKILTIRMGTEDAIFLNDYDSIYKVSISVISKKPLIGA